MLAPVLKMQPFWVTSIEYAAIFRGDVLLFMAAVLNELPLTDATLALSTPVMAAMLTHISNADTYKQC